MRPHARLVSLPKLAFPALRGAFAALLLTLCGCLHLKQELIIHRNGSARLLLHYSLPEDNLPLVRQLLQTADSANPDDSEPAWWLNRQACRDYLENTGLKLERHRTYTADNRTNTILECRTENLHDALENGPLKNLQLSETPDGNLLITVQNPELHSLRQPERIPENLRIELVITTPTDIIQTNGTQTEDRTVTWLVTRETLVQDGIVDFSVEFEPRGGTNRSAEEIQQ
ncbi:MAG: LppM family (lipo)protein [Verrucomicrobiota bacterium]